jgi:hypothetical protein
VIRTLSTILVATLGLTAAAPASAAPPERAPIAEATVEPLSGGIRGGRPQNASLVDVAPHGYVEEEYLVSGTATALPGADNDIHVPFTPLAIPNPPPGPTAPYATRIIVRRPADPARFNGTVFVDWNNVTLQTDFDSLWGSSYDLLMRRGYAYVSVSAQKQGVDGSPAGVKGWDPVRYAEVTHPGDAFAYDIFAQAAKAAPLGNLKVRHVIATGASQSGRFLGEFINGYHPTHERLFDGYLPQVWPGTDIRDDLVPILVVNSETESREVSQYDSGRFYRYWEIAGAMHGDIRQAAYLVATIARDQAAPAPVPPAPYASYQPEMFEQYGEREPGGSCPQDYMPSRYAVNAAVVAIDRWVRGSAEPARVAPFERDASGALERDADQNVRGGLRLPPMEVPVATYVGNECNLVGRMTQFDAAKLASLYPTHADYVAQMRAATDRAVATGIMVPEDGERLMTLAETSTIPELGP